jgi:hypothetical protein
MNVSCEKGSYNDGPLSLQTTAIVFITVATGA